MQKKGSAKNQQDQEQLEAEINGKQEGHQPEAPLESQHLELQDLKATNQQSAQNDEPPKAPSQDEQPEAAEELKEIHRKDYSDEQAYEEARKKLIEEACQNQIPNEQRRLKFHVKNSS